ncbi:snapalysin family zinc-dependent metalloprotease [Nocardia sp. NRRL S-836]|uniref:snapalysin family zinc-dependent metalloprotease n=1 Tax=Nocardia sp. NRRL S-836 TaxID=1519492 RepID=UPI0006AF8513|nr:snapalysin family zinc-dependent metalloprotease [Nocardia sp. NRRL S-836]
MFLRKTTAVLATVAALSIGVVGTAQAARTLTYNLSGAAQYTADIDAGAKVWNDNVQNVKLVKTTSTRANIIIVADDGWPRAQTTSLGNGRVWMGKQAIDQGYNKTRIAAHELGHILGLPDIKPGPCSSLMSGASAGVPCTNPVPNAAEKSRVERNFAGTAVVRTATFEDAA